MTVIKRRIKPLKRVIKYRYLSSFPLLEGGSETCCLFLLECPLRKKHDWPEEGSRKRKSRVKRYNTLET